MTSLDRWIIGALTAALSAVLWFILVDIRNEIRTMGMIVSQDGNRISVVEQKTIWLQTLHEQLQADLKDHRMLTEGKERRP